MKLEKAIELLKKYVAACNGTLPMAFSRRTLKEAIDTVVAELEKPLPTDKDIENEQNTLIEFSEYLENENGIIIPIELINEYTERNNNESNIN